MRIPLTKYGLPQVIIFPAAVLAAMIISLKLGPLFLPPWPIYLTVAVLAITLTLALSFFRDPYRLPPTGDNLLLAPADGKITDIETIHENNFTKGSLLKIGIFLSIFDTHINRAPCNATVEKITYKKGSYLDARNPQAGRLNESNDLTLIRTDHPNDSLLVRQISGAVARRIVCQTKPGQKLTGGQKFGMIKFGSRTELYVPSRENIKCLVKVGDKVKAGLTPLIRYEKCQD